MQGDLLDSGVAFDADKGSERRGGFLVRADEQHRFLGVAREHVAEPFAHIGDRRLAMPQQGRANAVGGMTISDGPLGLQRHHGDCARFAPLAGQRLQERHERPRRVDGEPALGEPGGEPQQSGLRLEMQQGREVTAHRQDGFVAPRAAGSAERREFLGEGRGQRRPVALRTRHSDRLERIRLENQPEADGLRCLPVVRDKHLDRVVEVREFNRRPGAGEPPAVAPQQHGVRLRWT